MILICGRYEGVDERFIEFNNLRRVSIGNYVISGGEAAAVVLSESVIRLLPHVLGNSDSKKIESFNNGLLEYPQYTKPRVWQNRAVPEILLSGNHKKISEWRVKKSIEITKSRLKK
jgi:tRNA (guanine37-N1)-methyltransferase